MYAHLIVKSVTPVVVTGYKLRSKITFEYGDITIETECVIAEGAPGTLSLCLYSDAVPARLPGGEMPKYDDLTESKDAELIFLSKTLPERDIVYVLSLLGVHRRDSVYEKRRRVRVEQPKGRKYKFYERYELLFSQRVDEAWLLTYGGIFGHKKEAGPQ